MEKILGKLSGGDRRSIGRVDEVVADVLRDPSLFERVFDGILSDDQIISMRAADAVEKITAQHPEYLQHYKEKLIKEVARIDQQEVRWHVAQMLPRLELSSKEQATAVQILLGYLDDESRIVKTFSMQALAEFAERDASLRPDVIELAKEAASTGTPAMKSRGRKLLQRLRSNDPASHSNGSNQDEDHTT